MPQYEVETPDGDLQRLRAKTPEDAARRAVLVDTSDQVALAPEADVQGWRTITLEGQEVGRVRVHNRMRFRRD
ncbi:MAG: hypothetical protein AAGI52_17230 [Bacteroidota bacterium]